MPGCVCVHSRTSFLARRQTVPHTSVSTQRFPWQQINCTNQWTRCTRESVRLWWPVEAMELPVSPLSLTHCLTDWLSVNDQFIIPHKYIHTSSYYTQKVTVSLYKNKLNIISTKPAKIFCRLRSPWLLDDRLMTVGTLIWHQVHWSYELLPSTYSLKILEGEERERWAPVYTNHNRQRTSPKYESSGEISHTTNPLRSESTLTEPLCEQWTAI